MSESASKLEHNANAAHRVVLMELLKGKAYGDRITAAEICEATGVDDYRKLGTIVRRWASDSGLPLQAVANDGWRICNANEVTASAGADRRAARRKEHKGLRKLLRVPAEKLSESERRRLEFETSRAAVRTAVADEHDTEIKRELKLGGERVPLLREHRPRE